MACAVLTSRALWTVWSRIPLAGFSSGRKNKTPVKWPGGRPGRARFLYWNAFSDCRPARTKSTCLSCLSGRRLETVLSHPVAVPFPSSPSPDKISRGRLVAESGAPASPSAVARLEDVTPDESRSFRVFEYKGPGFKRGWHYHPEVELIMFLESSGPLFVGDHIGTYGPGDMMLFGANLPHELRYVHGPVSCIWIHFGLDWFEDTFGDLPECTALLRLLTRAKRGLHFEGETFAAASVILQEMTGKSGLPCLIDLLRLLDVLANSKTGRTYSSPGFEPNVVCPVVPVAGFND